MLEPALLRFTFGNYRCYVAPNYCEEPTSPLALDESRSIGLEPCIIYGYARSLSFN